MPFVDRDGLVADDRFDRFGDRAGFESGAHGTEDFFCIGCGADLHRKDGFLVRRLADAYECGAENALFFQSHGLDAIG